MINVATEIEKLIQERVNEVLTNREMPELPVDIVQPTT